MTGGHPPVSRTVKLVLVMPDGSVVGMLPSFVVPTAWWSHAESVVEVAQKTFGISPTILRLLDAEKDNSYNDDDGGEVTYLAQIDSPVPANPWDGTLDEQPLRQSYAKVNGPKADLDWAISVLAQNGIVPSSVPVQVRTWNLSSIWRIPTKNEMIWLKSVPPFFAHEGRIIEAMQEYPVPQILGHDGGRILLKEIPGIDMYDAGLSDLSRMITTLVDIQDHWNDRVDELLAMGLPDWRGPSLTAKIEDVINRTADQLSEDECQALYGFVDGLPQRFAEVADCGMADTLVHGDFHAGNVRANDETMTILDWGDSGIGHPLLDQAAALERIADIDRQPLKDHWNNEWLKRNPSCDPVRAGDLLNPVACARQAVIYRFFMDNIEPVERRYHENDPSLWLRRTVAALRQG